MAFPKDPDKRGLAPQASGKKRLSSWLRGSSLDHDSRVAAKGTRNEVDPNSSDGALAGKESLKNLIRSNSELQVRITSLEEALKGARAKPDLSVFSESDLAVMASEAATSILIVAREQSEVALKKAMAEAAATSNEAQKILEASSAEAARISEAAATQSKDLVEKAKAEAAATSNEAQKILEASSAEAARLGGVAATKSKELADKAMADAATTRAGGIREAAAVLEKAKAEARNLREAALRRRDAPYEELEYQRKSILATLEDAAVIESLFIDGYNHLRKALVSSVANLIEPVKRARRQVQHLEREITAKDGASPIFDVEHETNQNQISKL